MPRWRMRHAVLVSLALAANAFAGSPKKGAAPTIAGISPGVVDGAEARKLVASGVKVVDVRTPAEFAAGHVPGALNIPYDEMERRYTEIGPPSTPILLYCKSGRRSGIAGKILQEKGYPALFDLRSYDRWVKSEPKR